MKTACINLCLGKVFRRDSWLRRAVALAVVWSFTLNVLANPTGMTVQRGNATMAVNGSVLTVNAGNNAVLNWQSFNIAAGETTTFNQPNAGSIVWNQINNQSASQIYGSLHANGMVVLLNSSGFYFGPNSFVSAAGLVVSTANCLPPQNAGGSWEFNGPPPLASIVNYGQIKIGNGGDCYLIADKVENHGTVEAAGGNIGLAAGQTVTLSERPDGRGMSMNVTLPQGSVDNYGNLIADGGTIALNAKVVNQNGLVQANSVQNQNGVIELVAADALNLGASSQILAQGDSAAAGSAGGNVTLQSGNNFSDTAGSSIVTAGGANGGNGGNVEISAPNIQSLHTAMNARAQAGFTGGEFLLDPVNIILGASPGSGMIDVNTAFAGFSAIKLQASGDITVNAGTTWNLSGSTGQSSGQLTLQAGGDIVLNSGAQITDANNWSVSLAAGYNFINNSINAGKGTLTLNDGSFIQTTGGNVSLFAGQDISMTGSGSVSASGSGSISATATAGSLTMDAGYIQASAGTVNLTAGQDITVGSGYVVTTGGGSINAHALAGNIDTGSDAQGYHFVPNATTIGNAYNLSHGLGGISTAAGGDVNLTAGGNVTSILPGNKGYYYDGDFITAQNNDYYTAGAGAYGKQAGNVNIVAGGNVTGNYVVANGTGSIFAGALMDANGNPVKDLFGHYVLGATGSAGTSQLSPNLALNLISGGWNVTAAQNIALQEVRNPNGDFNINGAANLINYFDYAPSDFVNLTAGNLVQLGGSALPRATGGTHTLLVPVIYPGILNVNAGAGGVILKGSLTYDQLILFPSPEGSLTLNTTGGGSLVSKLPTSAGAPQLFDLVVSDSGKQQYLSTGDFGLGDHASTPVHLGGTTPMELNISGDMDLVLFSAPEAAQINVVGNMNNSRFEGMNLNAADVTGITVGQAAKDNMEKMGLLNPATDGNIVVGGDINNRSSFTSVDLSQVAGATVDLSYLAVALDSFPAPTTLATSLYYNPATKILTYQNIPGVSLATVIKQLQNLTIQVYKNGIPQWTDPPYDTIPLTTTVSAIDTAAANALLAEYSSLGTAPAVNVGYVIGGGGKFNITAQNLDLGTTAGILSEGVAYESVSPGAPNALSELFTKGADINVNLTGDLNMFSSSIATWNSGNISIFAGGNISAGSPDFTVTATGARGIYSTAKGDVSVVANGDINVNGSRIAAYDGGNVTVESLDGNVNAGSGGNGYLLASAYTVDPGTRQINTFELTIPGSGILATTFPNDPGQLVGNVLVEAPNGTISASAGGIVQVPLNNTKSPDAIVEVLAGLELHDVNGNFLSADNLAQPTIQGDLAAAATGDLPHTVVIQNGNKPIKIQVSQTVWSELAAILNLTPGANQNLELNLLGGSASALQTALAGNGSGLANYNYATFASANRGIDASGSGVIGSNVKLAATGDILGVIFARNNISLTSQQNVNVTALAQGTVSANAGGSLTGTLIGIGGISASGGSIDAALASNSAISGDTSGSKGLAPGTAANATSAAMSSDNTATADKTANGSSDDDDSLSKKKKGIGLAQKVSRVTVILPGAKKLSEKATGNNPL
jgi:filamentous hemagglutinin family protein